MSVIVQKSDAANVYSSVSKVCYMVIYFLIDYVSDEIILKEQ